MFRKGTLQPLTPPAEKSQEQKIIFSLISEKKAESKDVYKDQKNGLIKVFDAVKKGRSLSVDLIKEFHQFVALESRDAIKKDFRKAPELQEDDLIPGEFRGGIVGTQIRDQFTKDGVVEILSLLEDEAKEGLREYHGTWLGPHDPEIQNLSMNESFRHDNIDPRLSKEKTAKIIFEDMQKRTYSFIYPRPTAKSLDVRSYLSSKMEELVDGFNNDCMRIAESPDEMKLFIVAFVKRCIRLHPFRELNHRVFALCVLNFLLLSNHLGYCPLKNRRVFTFNSLEDTLKIVNSQLKPLSILLSKHLQKIEEKNIPLATIKQSIVVQLEQYPLKGRLFSSRHAKEAIQVKTNVLSAHSNAQIRDVLKVQYNSLFKAQADKAKSKKGIAKNSKGKKGKFFTSIEKAVETYNQMQSLPRMRIVPE
jgi:hypothetical protein